MTRVEVIRKLQQMADKSSGREWAAILVALEAMKQLDGAIKLAKQMEVHYKGARDHAKAGIWKEVYEFLESPSTLKE